MQLPLKIAGGLFIFSGIRQLIIALPGIGHYDPTNQFLGIVDLGSSILCFVLGVAIINDNRTARQWGMLLVGIGILLAVFSLSGVNSNIKKLETSINQFDIRTYDQEMANSYWGETYKEGQHVMDQMESKLNAFKKAKVSIYIQLVLNFVLLSLLLYPEYKDLF